MLWAIPSTENFQRQHLAVACVCRKEIPLHFPPCYRIRTSTRNRETTEMTFPLGFPRILLKDMSIRWQERCENLLVWSGMDAPTNTLQALCEIPSLWHLIPSDLVRSYYFALSARLVLSSEFQPHPDLRLVPEECGSKKSEKSIVRSSVPLFAVFSCVNLVKVILGPNNIMKTIDVIASCQRHARVQLCTMSSLQPGSSCIT